MTDGGLDLDALTNLIVPEEPKKVDPQQEIVERIEEALNSTQGLKLALRLRRKDDLSVVIYQGLLANVWGRLDGTKLYIYNSRLNRLLQNHPATKVLVLER